MQIGGALADFWDPVTRGIAVAIFAANTFIGPVSYRFPSANLV